MSRRAALRSHYFMAPHVQFPPFALPMGPHAKERHASGFCAARVPYLYSSRPCTLSSLGLWFPQVPEPEDKRISDLGLQLP